MKRVHSRGEETNTHDPTDDDVFDSTDTSLDDLARGRKHFRLDANLDVLNVPQDLYVQDLRDGDETHASVANIENGSLSDFGENDGANALGVLQRTCDRYVAKLTTLATVNDDTAVDICTTVTRLAHHPTVDSTKASKAVMQMEDRMTSGQRKAILLKQLLQLNRVKYNVEIRQKLISVAQSRLGELAGRRSAALRSICLLVMGEVVSSSTHKRKQLHFKTRTRSSARTSMGKSTPNLQKPNVSNHKLKTESSRTSREGEELDKSIDTNAGVDVDALKTERVKSPTIKPEPAPISAVVQNTSATVLGSPLTKQTLTSQTTLISTPSSESICKLALVFCRDVDPRVRRTALSVISELHRKGVRFGVDVYQQALGALSDEAPEVRLEGMNIVWICANTCGASVANVGVETRMVDDAFAKVCDLVNDGEVAVRVRACQLLGSIRGVSDDILLQTLDKKVMAHLRKGKSARQKREEADGTMYPQGDSDFNPEEMSIIESGACGALVHGIEDEFSAVRRAAIGAMLELSHKSEEFSSRCSDYLVDMFNDEIDDVRLAAMHALRLMISNTKFTTEHVDIMLGVLHEENSIIRSAVLSLLGDMTFADVSGLRTVTRTLIEIINKYPEAHIQVWRTLGGLAKTHPILTEFIAQELLGFSPYFASIEPNVNDVAYIGVLIMVMNAAARNEKIIPLCPKHCLSHLPYLIDKWPTFFSTVARSSGFVSILGIGYHQQEINDDSKTNVSTSVSTDVNSSGAGQDQSIIARCSTHIQQGLVLFSQHKSLGASRLFSENSRELRRVSALYSEHSQQSTHARFYRIYTKVLFGFLKLRDLLPISASNARTPASIRTRQQDTFAISLQLSAHACKTLPSLSLVMLHRLACLRHRFMGVPNALQSRLDEMTMVWCVVYMVASISALSPHIVQSQTHDNSVTGTVLTAHTVLSTSINDSVGTGVEARANENLRESMALRLWDGIILQAREWCELYGMGSPTKSDKASGGPEYSVAVKLLDVERAHKVSQHSYESHGQQDTRMMNHEQENSRVKNLGANEHESEDESLRKIKSENTIGSNVSLALSKDVCPVGIMNGPVETGVNGLSWVPLVKMLVVLVHDFTPSHLDLQGIALRRLHASHTVKSVPLAKEKTSESALAIPSPVQFTGGLYNVSTTAISHVRLRFTYVDGTTHTRSLPSNCLSLRTVSNDHDVVGDAVVGHAKNKDQWAEETSTRPLSSEHEMVQFNTRALFNPPMQSGVAHIQTAVIVQYENRVGLQRFLNDVKSGMNCTEAQGGTTDDGSYQMPASQGDQHVSDLLNSSLVVSKHVGVHI
eukprot:CFRG4886T1